MPDAPCYVQGRPLEPSGRLKEVLVRVAVVTRHRQSRIRARVQMITRVTRPDQVVVRAEVVLRLRVLQGMEAEVVVRRRRVLHGMEVEMEAGVPPRLTLLLEAVRVVDVVDQVVVHLEVHRFHRGRRGRRMILRTSLMEQGSKNLGIRVAR